MPIKVPMSIFFNQPSDVCAPVGAEFSGASFLPILELPLRTNADTFGSLHAETRFENIGQAGQLLRAHAYVHADSYMRLQLGLHPGHGSQHADRGQLAALPIKVVALEDVANPPSSTSGCTLRTHRWLHPWPCRRLHASNWPAARCTRVTPRHA